MKPGLRWILLPFILFTLLVVFVAAEVPEKELDDARQVLHEAFEEGAALYSPVVYAKAEGALQAAEEEIAEQQHRWVWERDYSLAVDMLTWAIIDAVKAAQEAIRAKDEINTYYGLRPSGETQSLVPPHNADQYSQVNGWAG